MPPTGELKRELGGAADHGSYSTSWPGPEQLGHAFGEQFCPRYGAALESHRRRCRRAFTRSALPACRPCAFASRLIRPRSVPGQHPSRPVHWRHDGGFIGTWPAITDPGPAFAGARRSGYRDRDEPTGLLTHHLVQNDAVWQFTAELVDFVAAHPAARWLHADEIWPNDTD